MIQYSEVREVHVELSTNCNASCPLCPRNFHGYPYNAGYPDAELSLSDIQKIFEPDFIAQLRLIRINGNLGDFMLARDGLDIVAYFRRHNPNVRIDISTNGSARNSEFWTALAAHNPVVNFALDGLEDTHSLYRLNTRFDTVIKNAQSFINAGGIAVWKMVIFDHNRHQIEQARTLAKAIGFADFELVDQGRNDTSVFDKDGNITHTIGHRAKPAEHVLQYIDRQKYHGQANRYQAGVSKPKKLNCVTTGPRKSIYVAANGEVYPCCYMGFYPRTYDPLIHHGNEQVKELLGDFNNNALTRPLIECLTWFNNVQQAWRQETFDLGYPFTCARTCAVS